MKTAWCYTLTDCCRDSADIEVVRLADVLSDSVQRINDGVSAFHRGLTCSAAPPGCNRRRLVCAVHVAMAHRLLSMSQNPFEVAI